MHDEIQSCGAYMFFLLLKQFPPAAAPTSHFLVFCKSCYFLFVLFLTLRLVANKEKRY